ncbi:MAG: CapA family protein [Lentisphaeria bacterium]|nr:CapA family protein [Lentisphaeria bacterium]
MGNEIRIAVVADICPTFGLEDRMLEGDASRFIAPVKPLFERADLVVGNLETPLCEAETPIPKCGPNFIIKPALAPVIRDMGFDCLTLANNHTNDQGTPGLERTLETLDAHGIARCGAGMTHEEACTPAEFTVRDQNVAVFNFAEGEFSQAQENGPGAARLEPFWAERCVLQARERFDIILVVLHAGNEYQPIPSGVTVDFCRRMAAAGADAVIAHHAHIPQGTELFEGVPICFSLGNFLFGYEHTPEKWDLRPCWYLSTVAELVFTDEGATLELHPYVQTEDLSLAELSPTGRAAFDEYLSRSNAILADPARHQAFWEQEARDLFRGHRKNLPKYAQDLNSEDPAVSHRAATVLYNLVRCDAHHEAIQRGFRLMYEGRLEDDPQVQRELAELLQLVRDCFGS